MSKRYACALYLGFLTLPALAQTAAETSVQPEPAAAVEPAADVASDAVPATVVVEGRRPPVPASGKCRRAIT
ncbi:hypothetical protein [Massilia luteola]|uniref:hypothetical protein n=1 Tax=Massilia luteola TaxID=3081751 RepID=UPI002ACBED49|nr:hypothetical protein [Massilia sp. Gc5]